MPSARTGDNFDVPQEQETDEAVWPPQGLGEDPYGVHLVTTVNSFATGVLAGVVPGVVAGVLTAPWGDEPLHIPGIEEVTMRDARSLVASMGGMFLAGPYAASQASGNVADMSSGVIGATAGGYAGGAFTDTTIIPLATTSVALGRKGLHKIQQMQRERFDEKVTRKFEGKEGRKVASYDEFKEIPEKRRMSRKR